MKKSMKHFTLLFVAVLMMGVMASCKDEGPHNDPIIRFTSTLNSQNTQPRATSSAQGSAVLEYNKETRTLTYNITYQGLTPTAVVIHSAMPAWENGPAQFILTNVGTSPITGSVTLNSEQENLLVWGNMYINIRTEQNPFGEIRGQIMLDREEDI
ncbi:CHRD domain-containing protein [Telluribacter humicola]|uniref:CHRD domain-containing protein n=1 Tax=Telluribacter humicola TaxID=1720261 RepID=UPI001A96CA8C|nr:CHRD domain-containing protein [Telluribacter humicola]